MTNFIWAVVLAAVALLAVTLSKAYHHLPFKELKRQARGGNAMAKLLYKAAAYGPALQAMMFIITVLAVAGSAILLATSLETWVAFICIIILLWAVFLWLPTSRLTAAGARLAAWLTPGVSWILHYTHVIFVWLSYIIHDHYSIASHDGMYELDDLIDLMEWQKAQPDNRIPVGDISIAERALTFGGKKVSDIYVPRTSVQTVSSKDSVGPLLMDELHKSGHGRFPVLEGKPEHVIGTLYLNDAIEAKHGGKVSNLMKKNVHYVHEDFPLDRVLSALIKTKQHLFIVVNSFEEFVGIITIEDIFAQILGKPMPDEFDRYDDPRAVAEAMAKNEQAKRKEADIELSDEHLHEDVIE